MLVEIETLRTQLHLTTEQLGEDLTDLKELENELIDDESDPKNTFTLAGKTYRQSETVIINNNEPIYVLKGDKLKDEYAGRYTDIVPTGLKLKNTQFGDLIVYKLWNTSD